MFITKIEQHEYNQNQWCNRCDHGGYDNMELKAP